MALPWARLAGFFGRRSVLLQLIALGFLAGLVLARLGVVTHWHYVAAAVVLSVVVTLRKSRLAWFVLLVAALQLGILRGQAVLASFAGLAEHIGEDVVMVGRLEDDTTTARQYQTEFHLSDIHILQDGEPEAVDGRVVVRGFAEVTLQRGDVVRVEGKLGSSLGNNQAQISYAQIKLIGEDRTILGRARNAFFAGNRTALPEPQASLGMGFLVGLRALLPETLLNNLSATGLTHIVAASGYNLTVLVRLTRRLLAKHSKFIATATAVGLIVGFMAATGISPSIFRAAVVSGLSLAAWYWGRPITAWMVLLFSAAVTAGANPTYIWQDIGWYLSFAAFFGVLIIAPTITARLYQERQPGALTQLLIETFCAQIMALPIIMLIFDELSLLALPANMIILPFIPLAMLLTFVAALAGVFAPQIVGWFAWPADWVLTTMLYIIDWLAGVPWASIQLSLSPWQLVGVYGAIGIWLTVMRLRVRGSMDTYKTVID